jgi:hypothetical protein
MKNCYFGANKLPAYSEANRNRHIDNLLHQLVCVVALTNVSTQLKQKLSMERDTEPVLYRCQPRFKLPTICFDIILIFYLRVEVCSKDINQNSASFPWIHSVYLYLKLIKATQILQIWKW